LWGIGVIDIHVKHTKELKKRNGSQNKYVYGKKKGTKDLDSKECTEPIKKGKKRKMRGKGDFTHR